MHAASRPWLYLSLLKTACILFVLCAATAIASPAQTLTTLYSFCSLPNCADGEVSTAPLVQGTDGNFYGTTSAGGSRGTYGTVFKITPSGTLTSLYSFCSQPNCTDGEIPFGGLVEGTDGYFYGTTEGGGAHNILDGTVFKMTASGTLTTIYSFCFPCAEGDQPVGGLVQGTDGNFYGTTSLGGGTDCGGTGCGTVFRISSGGTLNPLHSFNGADGWYPAAVLIQATDGNFYGTTAQGGANNLCESNDGGTVGCGTVFKITPTGILTTLYDFCSQPGCADGAFPSGYQSGGLVQGTDGNVYGTTYGGGTGTGCYFQGVNGCGTIFKITPSGTLTTLYDFCSQPGCTDGRVPFAGLVQATDGNFYGTTSGGGTGGGPAGGTIFKITPKRHRNHSL